MVSKTKLLNALKGRAVCSKCRLFLSGEAKRNGCIKEHRLDVMVRWDLIEKTITKQWESKCQE